MARRPDEDECARSVDARLVVEGFLMSTFGTHLPDTIHQAMETDLKIHLSCDA